MEALSWAPPTQDAAFDAAQAHAHSRRPAWMARASGAALDATAVAAAMVVARAVEAGVAGAPTGPAGAAGYRLVATASLPLWLVAFSRYRLYQSSIIGDRRNELVRLLHAVVLGAALTALVAYGLGQEVSRAWLGLVAALALVATAAEREVVRLVRTCRHRAGRGLRPVAVVGTGPEAASLAAQLENEPRLGYRPVALVRGTGRFDAKLAPHLPLLDCDGSLVAQLRAAGAAGVVIAVTDVAPQTVNRLVRTLPDAGLHVELSSALQDIDAGRLSVRSLGERPVLCVEPVYRGGWRPAAKRAFDVVASASALLASLPLLLVAAVMVKATSPGPVLYRQERVGRCGRRFTILKLRSMHVDGEWRLSELARAEGDGPVIKLFSDPRVTPVGRLLRRFSIDEIPQFVNVLAGHMSMVGPRPEQASEVATWPAEAWARLRVRPGLTGLWQVSGRSEARAAKERWDLYYVDNWSLWQDLSILARTVPALVTARGAC